MAIAQQLQGESAQQNNTTLSTSVTLGAGSDRLMLVGVVGERAALVAPTSVVYGGNALAIVTDGTDTASRIEGTNGGVFWYVLREASLPANGANNLVITWPGGAVNYVMGWWILTGASQATNVVDVANNSSSTAGQTSITATLAAGATTDAALCVVYKNDTTGTVAITISGAGVTEDFDVSLTTGGARGAAGTDLPAVASGTIACVAAVSSTARTAISAIRVAEAVAVRNVSGSIALGATTVAGTATSPRNISGNIALGATTVAGGVLTVPRAVSGSIVVDPLDVSATMSIVALISGAIVLDPISARAEITMLVSISGNIGLGAITVAGTASAPASISGDIELGAVEVAGAVSADDVIAISGDVLLGAVEVAGSVEVSGCVISGNIDLGAVTVAGEVLHTREISGNVQLAAVTVSGSAQAVLSLAATLAVGTITVAGNVLHGREISGNIQLGAVTVAGASTVRSLAVGAATLGPVTLAGTVTVVTPPAGISGAVLLQGVEVSGTLRTQFPGSCLMRDRPAATCALEDSPAHSCLLRTRAAGSATLTDGPAGTVEGTP